MNSLVGYTFIGLFLVSVGALGVVVRRNIFMVYISLEIMLNGINLLFVTFARYNNSLDSQVIAMIIIAIAAAEAALFLTAIVLLFRLYKTLDSDMYNLLKQELPS